MTVLSLVISSSIISVNSLGFNHHKFTEESRTAIRFQCLSRATRVRISFFCEQSERFLLSLVKKLHRHTNANRQLVFDILGSKVGLCTSILITRARLLLLNDYEPSMMSLSLIELKEKLKIEINRSLEMHIQAHNQAIKYVGIDGVDEIKNVVEYFQRMATEDD